MHLLPHRRVTGHDPRFIAKNRYVGMVFKSWDEHDILRPQVAACPTRVGDQLGGFAALRTKIAASGVLTAKTVTHPYHFQRPHGR